MNEAICKKTTEGFFKHLALEPERIDGNDR